MLLERIRCRLSAGGPQLHRRLVGLPYEHSGGERPRMPALPTCGQVHLVNAIYLVYALISAGDLGSAARINMLRRRDATRVVALAAAS